MMRFLKPPRRMPQDVQEELQSLCSDAQFRQLPCGVRQDIGLDCGEVLRHTSAFR